MNRRTNIRTTAIALMLIGIGGCGLFSSKRKGPNQVNDLVGMIERIYVESEVCKGSAQTALVQLQAIVASDFDGEAAIAYADLVTAIEKSEHQAERLRDTLDPMKKSADPVFTQWGKDLDEFSSARMRQRSQERMHATRGRYDAIVAAVEPAQASLDAFNKGLRDHALFLSNDFNPASLAALKDDVKNLSNLASSLDKQFDECLLATRAYIETAALPVRVVAATPEPATVVPVSTRKNPTVTSEP